MLYEYKDLSHGKRRASISVQLRLPCTFAFYQRYVCYNLILDRFLHIEYGKYPFLYIDIGKIFTGLFKNQNVMVYILPRLLKKGQALKLRYCTLKKYSAIHLTAIPVWGATAKWDLRLAKYGVEVLFLTVDFEGYLHSGVPFPAVNVVKHRQLEWIMMTSCHLATKIGSCIIKKCVKLRGGTSENFS